MWRMGCGRLLVHREAQPPKAGFVHAHRSLTVPAAELCAQADVGTGTGQVRRRQMSMSGGASPQPGGAACDCVGSRAGP